jgi:uncharacterized FAD-dependent dehydrogenase
MKKLENLKVGLDEDLKEKLERLVPGHSGFLVLRESVDARRRHDVHRVVSVEVFERGETPRRREFVLEKTGTPGDPVLVVGSGPAGLFAALRLLERGLSCTLVERGSPAEKRLLAISRYWRYGELNPEDNVCFGEGGAGLYSDGKLMTRIKSEHIPYILRRLVEFGAPEEIEYMANPHVGSDRIRRLIPVIRKRILELGGRILFNTKMVDLLTGTGNSVEGVRVTGPEGTQDLRSPHVILATGHSAKDVFYLLRERGVALQGKSFAVGLRIEHPQELINKIQYRQHADHPALGAANYKLAHYDEDNRIGVYSFCMCPGGYILSSGTDSDGVVCNGMSNYRRNSPFANSGIVVSIDYASRFGESVFAGLEFQYELEKAFRRAVTSAGGDKQIPAQSAKDFIEGKAGEIQKTSAPSGAVPARLDEILPDFLRDNIRRGLEDFERRMKGFIGASAQLHAVESRTSSPVRVPRDPETLESLSHSGLFPVGEGAGYAGGITSAAADGIRAADKIFEKISSAAVRAP